MVYYHSLVLGEKKQQHLFLFILISVHLDMNVNPDVNENGSFMVLSMCSSS